MPLGGKLGPGLGMPRRGGGDGTIASLALALGAGGDDGYTAAGIYAFNLPSGITIAFKLWGGGGSAGSLFGSGSSGGAGGDGGFASGTYVTPSAGLLIVGIGMAPNARPGNTIAEGGLSAWMMSGAPGGYSYYGGNEGGQGGGGSWLSFNGLLFAVAGGGGGGGAGDRNGTTSGASGGQGGGATAGAGGPGGNGGAGGTQSPGPAMSGHRSRSPQEGGAPGSAGGGGGGGYGGGVGGWGRDYSGAYGDGGGGGSGYLHSSVIYGQNIASRNSSDLDYAGNAGKGGTAIYPTYVDAVDGRAVLRW